MPQASPPTLSPLELREPCANCGLRRGKHRAFDNVCPGTRDLVKRDALGILLTTFAPLHQADRWSDA